MRINNSEAPEKSLILLKEFLIQQNNYKSLCHTQSAEHDNFKFFCIIELHDRKAEQHIEHIKDSILFGFNKIFKTKSISTESIVSLFDKSIKDCNAYIEDLINLSHIPIHLKGLHLAVGVILEQTLLIAHKGDVRGFFLYKSKNAEYKLIDILAPIDKKNQTESTQSNVFKDVMQGMISPGQAIFICTESVGSYLTEYQLKQILTTENMTQYMISGHLKELTNNENFAGVILTHAMISSGKIGTKRPLIIEAKNEAKRPSASINRLETNRNKTQELLSPTLFAKISEWLITFIKKILRTGRGNKDSMTQARTSGLSSAMAILKQFTKKFISLCLRLLSYILNRFTKNKFNSTDNLNLTNTLNSSKKRLFLLSSIGVMILIFTISGFMLRSSQLKKQATEHKTATIAQIEENLLKAESSIIQKARERALIHTKEASTLLITLKEMKESGSLIETYTDSITKLTDRINQVRRINKPEIIVDVQNELKDHPIKGMEIKGNFIYLYAESNPYMITIDLTTYKITIIDSPKNDISIRDMAIPNDTSKPILLTMDSILYGYDEKTVVLNKITAETLNEKITDIKIYNKNLYALSPLDNQIYKYPYLSPNSFGKGKAWIKDSTIEISNVVDMIIDGTIITLSEDGTLSQFLNGKKTAFNNKQPFEPTIKQAKRLISSPTLKQYYIFNPSNKQIIAHNSTGDFLYQYLIEGINEITNIAYNSTNNSILLFGDQKIYEIKE